MGLLGRDSYGLFLRVSVPFFNTLILHLSTTALHTYTTTTHFFSIFFFFLSSFFFLFFFFLVQKYKKK
ncbi:hypothetical protein BDF14DRAFT_1427952 [Spinellus fusiger]|nr:hypothetical protein BDF14DRAFT_1427952 [Spinellus fusiger]